MECVDHAAMLGCFEGGLWANCAAFLKNVVVFDAVRYLNCKGLSWLGQIPNRSPKLTCNERTHWTMRLAAVRGQSWGLIASQKKGIFTPFFLFFCVCHQMHTEAMVANGCVAMLATGISPSSKNSKSSGMKDPGGCEGQEVMCL